MNRLPLLNIASFISDLTIVNNSNGDNVLINGSIVSSTISFALYVFMESVTMLARFAPASSLDILINSINSNNPLAAYSLKSNPIDPINSINSLSLSIVLIQATLSPLRKAS